jgi:hypothetical protein
LCAELKLWKCSNFGVVEWAESQEMYRTLRKSGSIRLAVLVLLPLGFATAAQDPTIPSRRAPAISRDMRYREWVLKELERRGRQTRKEEEVNWKQIRDDFRSIQLESDGLRQAASKTPIDSKAVVDSASKINKTAVRLKSGLLLPEDEVERKATEIGDVSMQTIVSALDGTIRRFVTNPTFDEATVLDLKLAIKARHDLDRIIVLSREVKKKAEP